MASAAGLSAEVLYFDPKDGTMLSGFIEGTQMDEVEFHRDPTALGNLSVEGGFDADQERSMMEAYCEGDTTRALYGRMVLQKAMSDYFWDIWSVVRHANGNPAADFLAYATGRFERCKALMETGEFADCREAVMTERATKRW